MSRDNKDIEMVDMSKSDDDDQRLIKKMQEDNQQDMTANTIPTATIAKVAKQDMTTNTIPTATVTKVDGDPDSPLVTAELADDDPNTLVVDAVRVDDVEEQKEQEKSKLAAQTRQIANDTDPARQKAINEAQQLANKITAPMPTPKQNLKDEARQKLTDDLAKGFDRHQERDLLQEKISQQKEFNQLTKGLNKQISQCQDKLKNLASAGVKSPLLGLILTLYTLIKSGVSKAHNKAIKEKFKSYQKQIDKLNAKVVKAEFQLRDADQKLEGLQAKIKTVDEKLQKDPTNPDLLKEKEALSHEAGYLDGLKNQATKDLNGAAKEADALLKDLKNDVKNFSRKGEEALKDLETDLKNTAKKIEDPHKKEASKDALKKAQKRKQQKIQQQKQQQQQKKPGMGMSPA